MSAEVLREASRLMRERANACDIVTAEFNEGWYVESELIGPVIAGGDQGHIASWRPTVALAVADWLEAEAQAHFHLPGSDRPNSIYDMPGMTHTPALAVARAYLGVSA